MTDFKDLPDTGFVNNTADDTTRDIITAIQWATSTRTPSGEVAAALDRLRRIKENLIAKGATHE
jgi:hypothetical protein